jgi:hypothetical protein
VIGHICLAKPKSALAEQKTIECSNLHFRFWPETALDWREYSRINKKTV